MEITALIQKAGTGDPEAAKQLAPFVYQELKKLAAGHLKNWNSTVNATALVHEAYLRMAVANPARFEDRAHFFGIASRVMRNVLVDMVRHAKAQKRGPGLTIRLEDIGDIGDTASDQLLELDQALDRLAVEYPRIAQLVEMRFFAGMTVQEASTALSISTATATRDLRFANAWLRRELSSLNTSDPI